MSNGDMQSSSSVEGVFKPGTSSFLLLKITNLNGFPQDPSSVVITIEGPTEAGGAIVINGEDPFQVVTGYYIYEWEIDKNQDNGTYNVTWEYVLDGETKYEYQTVVVSKDVDAPDGYSESLAAYRIALQYHLSCAQNIPIYFEQAKTSRDRSIFQFTFGKWNQSPGVKIYRNKEIMTDNIKVDYFNGMVQFVENLLPQDIINADYNFRWFSDDELNRFLYNSLSAINMFPPATRQYTLNNLPERFMSTLLYGATKDALRQLMMCLQFQETARVFGDSDRSQQAFSNFETLKKNYEADWKELLSQKKLGPYPSIRGFISPTYTLPGGRSRWFRMLFS